MDEARRDIGGGNPPDEAAAVLRFWFEELAPEQWWKRDEAVDRAIAERFAALHARLSEGVPADFLETARGRLAAVIVLDQFSRNLYRDDARAYANDPQALALAKETLARGLAAELTASEKTFLYMPFQHSEDAGDQARSVELFAALGEAESLDFAQKHKLVVDRFGRFPHRNAVLGRESTPEERAFLERESWFW